MEDLMPRVITEFARQFGRPIVELQEFHEQLRQENDRAILLGNYCAIRSPDWIQKVLKWESGGHSLVVERYGEEPESQYEVKPTEKMIEMVKFLCKLAKIIKKNVEPIFFSPVISSAIVEILTTLMDSVYWHGLKISLDGLYIFTLDIKLLVASGKNFQTDDIDKAVITIIEHATHMYEEQKGEPLGDNKKDDEWYQNHINQVLADPSLTTLDKNYSSTKIKGNDGLSVPLIRSSNLTSINQRASSNNPRASLIDVRSSVGTFTSQSNDFDAPRMSFSGVFSRNLSLETKDSSITTVRE